MLCPRSYLIHSTHYMNEKCAGTWWTQSIAPSACYMPTHAEQRHSSSRYCLRPLNILWVIPRHINLWCYQNWRGESNQSFAHTICRQSPLHNSHLSIKRGIQFAHPHGHYQLHESLKMLLWWKQFKLFSAWQCQNYPQFQSILLLQSWK